MPAQVPTIRVVDELEELRGLIWSVQRRCDRVEIQLSFTKSARRLDELRNELGELAHQERALQGRLCVLTRTA